MKLYQEAEKYIKDIYWKETHDSHSKLNLPKIIEEKLIEDNTNKDPTYFSHREGVVHSTSLSKCLRGVIYEMLGTQKTSTMDARKLGIFKAGNLFEDFVIQALGNRVVHEQREYEYKYKNITLVGRSDYTIDDEGVLRIGENKSVHSDSFWMREREGTLVAWQNQVQLQTYLWLERILDPYQCSTCKRVILSNVIPTCAGCKEKGVIVNAPEQKILNPHGVFSYISKDDCTVIGAPIQYNPHFVDEIIQPALDIINDGYTNKNPNVAPVPPMTIFAEAKHQYQKNWLCTYCEYHEHCAGAGWLIEATNQVTVRNKELKAGLPNPFEKKKAKTTIVVEAGELPPEVQPE